MHKGPGWQSGKQRAGLISRHAWCEIARSLRLTDREVQIIQGVFDNLPEAQIATRLKISDHTVHTHLNRIFKKVRISTRTELVLRVFEEMLALAGTGVLPPICSHHQAGGGCLPKPPAAKK